MRKILIYSLILTLLMSFLMTSVAFALSPPPPCDEYTIDEKEVLDGVLNSPQMEPLNDWELSEYQFSECASFGIFRLSLKYILPENFSKLGFRYISQFTSIRLSTNTKKAEDSSLNTYNRLASEAEKAIQSAENNNRIKEFINKIGAEEYFFKIGRSGIIELRNNSVKSYIIYSHDNQQFSGYAVPVEMDWQNYPEISRLQSIFREEVLSENCSLDFQDGVISSKQYENKGKISWSFNQTVKGAGCPSWIIVHIYEDGTYKTELGPITPVSVVDLVEDAEEPVEVETSDEKEGIKEIKSSAEVSAMIISLKELDSIQSIQLKDEGGESIYEVVGIRKVKFLFFIPVSLKIRMKVDTVTGDIKAVKKSWWSFLVW